jgi:hypothetical protein
MRRLFAVVSVALATVSFLEAQSTTPPSVNERRLTGVTLIGGPGWDAAFDIDIGADGRFSCC